MDPLPVTGIELRNSVAWFAEQMEAVLEINDYKGGWENCTEEYLTKRIIEELDELKDALQKRKPNVTVLHECADVANFAMMIAELYVRGIWESGE